MSQSNFCCKCNVSNTSFLCNRIGTSIARWCSSGCECPIPEPPPCGEGRAATEPCFLFLSQDTEFSLEAGEALPFAGRAVVSGDCFLCEEEVAAQQNMVENAEGRHGRRHRRRRPCRCQCNVRCPDLELCCLPIVDEVAPPPRGLCMCGCCEEDEEIDRSECFHFENGIVFLAPGIYLVEYTILVPNTLLQPMPNCPPVTTEVHLVANGDIVPGSSRTFATTCMISQTVQAKVLLEVTEPTSLSLITTNAFTLTPAREGDLFVTMSIVGFG